MVSSQWGVWWMLIIKVTISLLRMDGLDIRVRSHFGCSKTHHSLRKITCFYLFHWDFNGETTGEGQCSWGKLTECPGRIMIESLLVSGYSFLESIIASNPYNCLCNIGTLTYVLCTVLIIYLEVIRDGGCRHKVTVSI